MTLECRFQRHTLPLEFPFTIARGSKSNAEIVTVEIEGPDGSVGVGGGSPSAYYGETIETVCAVLPELFAIVTEIGDPHHLDRIERQLAERIGANGAARCAVSIALHDLVATQLDTPLYRYWGLDPTAAPETSYTIGIDDVETMREKTELALDRGHETLKVKVGTDRDVDILRAIRSVASEATLYVDANAAWTPREAVETIERIEQFDVTLLEQPVSPTDRAGLKYVYEHSSIPIVADESCLTATDVPTVADSCDVVNLKLMKCGGLREAMRFIHTAHAHSLEVMCGCQIESTASISAACHLAPLIDYADLDGALLLADDPYDGVPMTGGQIGLETLDRSGTGVRTRP